MDNLHQHARIHLRHARRETRMPSDEVLPREAEPVSSTSPVEISKVILPRSTDSGSSDDSSSHKNTTTPTVAIVVAVVVPVLIAIFVLIWLHRRHVNRLRAEDMNDPHKSLDFGLGAAGAAKKGKKGKKGGEPEMTMTDEKALRGRGVSMDLGMGMGNPYILPAGLNGSHDSLHSLSRTVTDSHDPYRPVTFIKDDASLRGGSSLRGIPHDQSSMYTTSSGVTKRSNLGDGLLRNAQRMSQSHPPRGESLSPQDSSIPEIKFPEPAATSNTLRPDSDLREASPPPPPPPPAAALQPGARSNTSSPPQSDKYASSMPAELMSPPSTLPNLQEAHGPTPTSPSPPPLPRVQSQEAVVQNNANTTSFMSDSSYGEGFKVTPPSPPRESEPQMGNPPTELPAAPVPIRESIYANGLGVDDLGYDPRRLSMSLRPLPPDDPQENPEERANRIRSFYKEYFDDSKPEPQGNMYGDYYEDYGSEYLDGAVFDPDSGQFVVASKPFAQPVTRRAMTPPPRAPPRFRSGSMGPRGNHFSSGSSSTGRFMPPRGMSSMSGRLPTGPRKPLPPPAPLSSLPTPAKLSEDSMVFNPIDFAPPVSFRDRQQGRRPESPLGAQRPYSPSVRPHTPLASSFDDLTPMPSPHMLRRSGTFTALDFAPPRPFRDTDSGSDAGSIRSNRSGISAAGRMGVRNGAYRVSKIPKGVVGTKDDIAKSLRPQLSMVAPA